MFSLSFTLLAVSRIISYPEGYIRFAMLDLVAEYRLVYFYFLFGLIEILLIFSIFFLKRKFFKTITDIGLLLYVPWLLLYYMILYNASGGCIECNYTTHLLGENIIATGIILIALSGLYLFYLRDHPNNLQKKEIK